MVTLLLRHSRYMVEIRRNGESALTPFNQSINQSINLLRQGASVFFGFIVTRAIMLILHRGRYLVVIVRRDDTCIK